MCAAQAGEGSDADALGALLQRLATRLPATLMEAVLAQLPCVEVARLACVHKTLLSAWRQLRVRGPGARWEPPGEELKAWLTAATPLQRAAQLGDAAVAAKLLAAGADVNEDDDSPLSLASFKGMMRWWRCCSPLVRSWTLTTARHCNQRLPQATLLS